MADDRPQGDRVELQLDSVIDGGKKPFEEIDCINKGLSLEAVGKFQEALACYDRALQLNPRFAEAWHSKGAALGSLKRPQEAITCFNRALELNPQ